MGWVLFRSATLADAGLMLKSLAGLADVSREARVLWLDFNPKLLAAMTVGIVLSFPIVPWLRETVTKRNAELGVNGMSVFIYVCEWVVLTFLGITAMLFIAGGSYNPFLYFRF